MGDEKDEGPKLQDYLKMFDLAKNKDWIELRKDHEQAHTKGDAAHGLESKIGLSRKQINEALGKYIDAYEGHLTGTSDDASFKAYRKKLSATKAQEFIQEVQRQNRGFDYQTLQEEGIEKLLQLYRENTVSRDKSLYQKAITEDFVNPQDLNSVTSVAKQIIAHNPAEYNDSHLFEIQKDIHRKLLSEGYSHMRKMQDEDKPIEYKEAS